MRIVVAPDSFKGCLTALEVCDAMEAGIREVWPEAEVEKVPMADGGEGTVQSLVDATGGRVLKQQVTGPLGEPVEAQYGILGDGETAVIEMASASGLPLVPEDRRNPLMTTTRGTGELIVAALDRGCRKFIVGIGGSATNDCGQGMAKALGVRFLDADGIDLGAGGGSLASLDRIDISGLDGRVGECSVVVACDVDNPLCGERGASAVYGPQKGATPEVVRQLDANLARCAEILKRDLGKDVGDTPGAGAAGGLGAGLMAFLNAELRLGVDIVLDASHLEDRLRGADLVLTGEGRIDRQTVYGKTPIGVAKTAAKLGVPVIGVGGSIADDATVVHAHGIDGLIPIVAAPIPLTEAMARGAELVRAASARGLRLFQLGQRAAARVATAQQEVPAE
ncbi:MAG: glycerate kinase [Armatimonadetes bacterium CG_4_10_14_3_um_filter_66_18]|nr:MAG: glycerate kinase [Armatimonadetes bacterium CG_4_10_14_3_um_filter_66_18]